VSPTFTYELVTRHRDHEHVTHRYTADAPLREGAVLVFRGASAV